MNIDNFLSHYQMAENPFVAEEARLDPVFDRLKDKSATHPDFAKIIGSLQQPSTSVVFGEKGSGKTAIRLLIGQRIQNHNNTATDQRILLVPYDDLNPVLDNLLKTRNQNSESLLKNFKLEDHQDAILSLAVTRLIDAVLNENTTTDERPPLPDNFKKRLKKLPRQAKIDLGVLLGLYDQPQSADINTRWQKMKRVLRLGGRLAGQVSLSATKILASILTIAAAVFIIAQLIVHLRDQPWWLPPAVGITLGGAIVLWGYWVWRHAVIWWRCKNIRKEMPAIDRNLLDMRRVFVDIGIRELARQPLPAKAKSVQIQRDSRYQLTRKLLNLLRQLGFAGMIVLIDRVDEPTLVSGNPDKMKAIIWPMLDNKFLQQDGIGFKLLLPLELRHLLMRESGQFFQEARLDKQNLIDRLSWSGPTLYDLCNSRINACRPETQEVAGINLTDMFEPEVNRDNLIDALDQMHQPRDAFKFIYSVIQEHCRITPEDQANYKIARLTLESIRKDQSQRVQELYRGLAPA